MKNLSKLILLVVAVTMIITGCKKSPSIDVYNNEDLDNQNSVIDKLPINVVVPSGAPTISILRMMKEKPAIGGNVELNYDSLVSTDVLQSKLISQEADIAIVPTNLAVNMYNKGLPYKLLGVPSWGNLYLVSSQELSSIDDIKGKEIKMLGNGLTPDIVFKHILNTMGIDPEKDVTLDYAGGAQELAPLFISGKSTISIMPEPMLTNVLEKKSNTSIIIDFQTKWAEATEGSRGYPQAVLIVKDDLLKNHKPIVDNFIEKYKASVNWANENPDKAGQYAEELEIGLTKDVVEQAIPRMNILYKSSKKAKKSVKEFLEIIFETNPKSVGGKLPDDDFYVQ